MEHTLYLMIQDLHRKLDIITARIEMLEELLTTPDTETNQETTEETKQAPRIQQRRKEE